MTSYLLCYDVGTLDGGHRLRAVARACEGYGVRVQHSVFELELGEAHLVQLLAELREIMDPTFDNIRIYGTGGVPLRTLGHAQYSSRDSPTHW